MLESFIDYLKNEDKSTSTIEGYTRAVSAYFDWFSGTYGHPPGRLFIQNILEFKSYLQTVKKNDRSKKPVDGKTINYTLSALRKFNEYLVSTGIQNDIVINKKMYVKIQSVGTSPAKITESEVNKLRQVILEGGSKRDYALINILCYCGLRISEALNLTLQDLNLQSQELKVRHGKGDKQRIVYINEKVVNSIKDYLNNERNTYKTSNSNYLFVSNRNDQLNRITVCKLLTNYSQKAKISPIHPHLLRHHFCSNALEKGFTVAEVSCLAGHSNIHTTLRYTNPQREKMVAKVNTL